MRPHVLLFGLVLVPLAATAETKPAEIESVIRAQRPLGEGSMSKLMITAYDASLWTDGPAWSASQPFALKLSYHMAFSTSEIVDRSIAEMKSNDPALSETAAASYRSEMLLLGLATAYWQQCT